jgi:membrane protein implicated in regulation of membrane protease activity
MTKRSVFALARQLITDFIALAKLEVEHGRQEIGLMLAGAKRGAMLIGIALGLLLMAMIAVVMALILGIAALSGLPAWLTALTVFLLLVLIAGVVAWRGIRRIHLGPPEETIASVREEVAWAKRLIRRG